MRNLCLILISNLLLFTSNGFSQNPKLVSYTLFPCDKYESFELIQKRIISENFNNDTLCLVVATVLNCCDGDTSRLYLNGDTLSLQPYQKTKVVLNSQGDTIELINESCDCECCFTIEYKILGLAKKKYKINLSGEPIKLLSNKYLNPKYEIRGNDTLYYNDEFGYNYYYSFYKSGKVQAMKKWKSPHFIWKSYYENGQIKNEREFYKNVDNGIYKEFDESGNLIRIENTLKE